MSAGIPSEVEPFSKLYLTLQQPFKVETGLLGGRVTVLSLSSHALGRVVALGVA
jgi:hypothetical protein